MSRPRSSTPTARCLLWCLSTFRVGSNCQRCEHRRPDPEPPDVRALSGNSYKTGTTNQNVYAARALVGFAASSPSGNKALGAVTRSFVVYVRNDTGVTKTFRLQIANQPPGGVASFDQFNPTQFVVEPSSSPGTRVSRGPCS